MAICVGSLTLLANEISYDIICHTGKPKSTPVMLPKTKWVFWEDEEGTVGGNFVKVGNVVVILELCKKRTKILTSSGKVGFVSKHAIREIL